MLDNILRYEEKATKELPDLEQQVVNMLNNGNRKEAQILLNQYSSDFAGATRQTWNQMEQKFWEMFWTGF